MWANRVFCGYYYKQKTLSDRPNSTPTLTREVLRNLSCSSKRNGKFSTNGSKNASKRLQVWLQFFRNLTFAIASGCYGFYVKRKQCEICMGLSPKKPHSGCGLGPGSFRVRKSYPNFWTYYCKLTAHGCIHDNAKWLAREALELRKEEKTLEKCQKRKDEEAESAHAQQMLEKINKKRNR